MRTGTAAQLCGPSRTGSRLTESSAVPCAGERTLRGSCGASRPAGVAGKYCSASSRPERLVKAKVARCSRPRNARGAVVTRASSGCRRTNSPSKVSPSSNSSAGKRHQPDRAGSLDQMPTMASSAISDTTTYARKERCTRFASAWHRCFREQTLHYTNIGYAFESSFGRERETMCQYPGRRFLDVIRRDEIPTVQSGHDARRLEKCQRPAGRNTQGEPWVLARGLRQVEHVGGESSGDVKVLELGARRREQRRLEHADSAEYVLDLERNPAVTGQNFCLHLAHRIVHVYAQHEAIELRFRQRVGALELARVLRSDDQEVVGQTEHRALDAHLALLHRLEQRGLRLRAGAIDLIDQQHVGEQRAGMEHEGTLLLLEYVHADDVARHEIGSALDTLELTTE